VIGGGLPKAHPTDGEWNWASTVQTMHDGTVLRTWGVMVEDTLQWIGKAHPLGETVEQQAEAHANVTLFAASKQMATLLDEAVQAWAAQFDGPEDQDRSVSGADLMDWFAQWRLRARQVLRKVQHE
jgi:hypothetical protein